MSLLQKEPKDKNWNGLSESKEMEKEKKTIIFRGEVAYDINSLPLGANLETIIDTYTKSGILVYDATLGKAPYSVKFNLPKSE